MKKLFVLLGLLLACGDSSDGASDAGTCEPLAPRPQAAQLGSVIAAGTAPDGVTYVVTRDGSDERVYVSEGDTLVRRRVLGSGFSVGDSELVDDTVSFEDTQTSRLVFQSDDRYAVRMALVHDDQRTFYEDATNKVELTVIPESAVSSRPVRNLPGSILLAYAATTVDGQQLTITRAQDDAPDYRLFLGRNNELQELTITDTALSSFAQFDFVLNGRPGSVWVAGPLSPSTPSVLRHDDGEWALTLLPTGSGLPSGWRFYCR